MMVLLLIGGGVLVFLLADSDGLLFSLLVLVSLLCGGMWVLVRRPMPVPLVPEVIDRLLCLARDPQLADVHDRLTDALLRTADRTDSLFRLLARQQLERLITQAQQLGEGTIEYASTESWRIAYEELLRSPGLHSYLSVAHIESPHYWQDGPGQQSTRLNLELQASGTLTIERIAIIADHLWPEAVLLPIIPIHDWLDEQHRHGIRVRLVRESQLDAEPDLLNDLGIYGSRAVGLQRADVTGRTQRFVLRFDFEQVRRAEAVWSRLLGYATPYKDLLNQKH